MLFFRAFLNPETLVNKRVFFTTDFMRFSHQPKPEKPELTTGLATPNKVG